MALQDETAQISSLKLTQKDSSYIFSFIGSEIHQSVKCNRII